MQAVYARSPSKYEGTVESYSPAQGTAVISGRTYFFDRETVVHHAIDSHQLKRLSVGLSKGKRVEFNIQKSDGAYSRVSELWFLSE